MPKKLANWHLQVLRVSIASIPFCFVLLCYWAVVPQNPRRHLEASTIHHTCFSGLAADMAREAVILDGSKAAAALELRAKLANKGTRKARPGSSAEQVQGLFDSLGQQQALSAQDQVDERTRAEADLKRKIAERKQRTAALDHAASEVDVPVQDIDPVFDYLDPMATGHVTASAVGDYHRSLHSCTLPQELVVDAIRAQVGAATCTRDTFFRVLGALHILCRKQSQLQWDFRCMDHDGAGTISLSSAAKVWDFQGRSAGKFTVFAANRPAHVPADRFYWDEFETALITRFGK
jgi:hypothetical protein